MNNDNNYRSNPQLAPPWIQQQEQQEQEQEQPDKNIKEILDEIWNQTQVNLCLLVEMLKEKKKTDTSDIISDAISKIENAPIPVDSGKIECDPDKIEPILSKIKNTMKFINTEMSDEQILDSIIGANISLIKKYIKLYVDIIEKINDKSIIVDKAINEAKIKEGLPMFLAIPKILDDLLKKDSSLNEALKQGQSQDQSFGKVEVGELITEFFALATATGSILGGKTFKRKSRKIRKGRKSRKSKKKRSNKRHRKLTK